MWPDTLQLRLLLIVQLCGVGVGAYLSAGAASVVCVGQSLGGECVMCASCNVHMWCKRSHGGTHAAGGDTEQVSAACLCVAPTVVVGLLLLTLQGLHTLQHATKCVT